MDVSRVNLGALLVCSYKLEEIVHRIDAGPYCPSFLHDRTEDSG